MTITPLPTSVPYDSSVYLVVSDRTMLVDAGTGIDRGLPSRIREALGGRDLDMVVATHCHYDHIGGIAAVVEEFGCPVYAGERDLAAITDADDTYTLASHFGASTAPMEALPLRDGELIDLGGMELKVIWTPGHTPGSICLHDERSGALISGDTLFETGIGRTDFPGGSMGDMRRSLRLLSNIDIRELYPGHGSVCYNCGPWLMSRALTLAGV